MAYSGRGGVPGSKPPCVDALVYFAAFKKYIGMDPPIRGADEKLVRPKAGYEGPKGNLKFPLDQLIPHLAEGFYRRITLSFEHWQ